MRGLPGPGARYLLPPDIPDPARFNQGSPSDASLRHSWLTLKLMSSPSHHTQPRPSPLFTNASLHSPCALASSAHLPASSQFFLRALAPFPGHPSLLALRRCLSAPTPRRLSCLRSCTPATPACPICSSSAPARSRWRLNRSLSRQHPGRTISPLACAPDRAGAGAAGCCAG